MASKGLPRISIITPSFNQGRYIEQCIQSVLNQGYSDIEHIVIDGGSSDETLDVLRKYSHLKWVSENDKGQADALNKGFSRASGEIFGWLNSDDFYAPRIFEDVAKALEDYPIVMGACELTDENGAPKSKIVNKERGWFELLKYWVPYSIPTQPSIFFSRGILESVRRPDGSLFNTELNYCMDYDLWMRIAQAVPFSRRIDRTLSYYRMTPDNKTSDAVEGMPYAEPEMSRVYRAYRERAFNSSYEFSVIIKGDSSEQVEQALSVLMESNFKDFEVLVSVGPQAHSSYSEIRKSVQKWNEVVRTTGMSHFARVLKCEKQGLGVQLNEAISSSEGRVISLQGDSYVGSLFLLEHHQRFQIDRVGASVGPFGLFARKIALLEIDGFSENVDNSSELFAQATQSIEQRNWAVAR